MEVEICRCFLCPDLWVEARLLKSHLDDLLGCNARISIAGPGIFKVLVNDQTVYRKPIFGRLAQSEEIAALIRAAYPPA